MVPSEDTWHVSRVHKRVLKLVNFFVQNLQKPYMFDLVTHSPLICDALWSICHIGGFWAPLQNCFVVLHPCVLLKNSQLQRQKSFESHLSLTLMQVKLALSIAHFSKNRIRKMRIQMSYKRVTEILFCLGLCLTIWRSYDCLQKYSNQNLSTKVSMVKSTKTFFPSMVICPTYNSAYNVR